jgi:hypothetical protein
MVSTAAEDAENFDSLSVAEDAENFDSLRENILASQP